MKYWIVIALCMVLGLAACNVAKDTGKTTQQGGQNAAGLAEKMKGGTVGDTDQDTGESPDASGSGGE